MPSTTPPPPSPKHLLRSHSDPISALCFSDDNERLYSGDTSGLVVITSTRTLRSLVGWKAHESGVLGVREWDVRFVITHGRDNKLHVWKRVEGLSETAFVRGGSSARLPQSAPVPELCYSFDVNALNFCAFSFLDLAATAARQQSESVGSKGVAAAASSNQAAGALIAVPNLVESSLADVWVLPSRQRLHAAIGKTRPEGSGDTGIIMSLHLHYLHPGTSEPRLLIAYENGSVEMWRFCPEDGKESSVEGVGWESVWRAKIHVESVMSTAISNDSTFALSVSADHLIGRYDFQNSSGDQTAQQQQGKALCTTHRTKHPGNASIAIHDNGKICAVGSWDGKIRLFSTKTLKPLGTLSYHKTSCQVVVFARSEPVPRGVSNTQDEHGTDHGDGEEDEEMDEDEKENRKRWLVGGGKDGRISIWALMDFQKR